MQIEDLANQSLDLIGYKRHIGSIYEGTPAARVVLDNWWQTRDALLMQVKPDWAKKQEVLILLKTAPVQYDPVTPWLPAYPPLPWKYEYAYPDDCIHPLQITVTPNTFPVWRPRYSPFRVGYDTGVLCVLSNEPGAILAYIGKAFDVNLWENDFVDTFVQMLARKISPLMPRGGAVEEKKDGGDTAS